jgi:cytochrome c oxidase subunit 3
MTALVIMFIALMTGVTTWWVLIQRLQTKPWIDKGVVERSVTGMAAQRVGLRVFLGTVTSIFAVSSVAYIMRMSHSHGSHDWVPLVEPRLLWFNTALLILASIALQRARNAAGREQLGALKVNLTAGWFLTCGFIIGQLWAWRELSNAGFYLTGGPAVGFFYLLTGAHGLHMLGGLWVLAKTTTRVWHGLNTERGHDDMSEVRLSVQLCSVYWHYLLLVWLALFTLLLTT